MYCIVFNFVRQCRIKLRNVYFSAEGKMANTTSHTDSLETKKEDKPRWIYFFDRDSHKRYTEHLRDKEYNEVNERFIFKVQL